MKAVHKLVVIGLCSLLLYFLPQSVKAQEDCAISQSHGQGYVSTITSVIDNGDDSHTITIRVENSADIWCKKLRRYSIEAEPGTYSDIDIEIISGQANHVWLYEGPYLFFNWFQGFQYRFVPGFNHNNPGVFEITYTLAGGLQDQRVRAHVAFIDQVLEFTAEDFQSVLDCSTEEEEILPYYPPPAEGKVEASNIIGAELTSLFETFVNTGTYISDDIFQIVGQSVVIDIRVQPGEYNNALSLLTSAQYGLTQPVGNQANDLISGLFPIENLIDLNELPNLLKSARPVYSALANAGLIVSQGDTSLRAFRARDVFDVSGAGVKVGVLSDSYNTILGNPAGDDVIREDLPGADNENYSNEVDVVGEYPYGTRSDEGRAMLQIVHDVAPGADLAFRTGFLGAADFAAGIQDLADAGCDIIVDDITYISEPFFRDGVVAQAVDAVKSQGVSYFSAAGNFGERSWQSSFAPVAAPAGITGDAHNFAAGDGGTDIYQSVKVYQGQYTVVMQWDDGTPGNTTSSDYDIYLSNDDGNTLFGFNRVNTGDEAIEVLPFTVAADSAETNILIIRADGTAPALLKYIVYRGDLVIQEYETPGASTITGQANAEGAISVGAVLYSNTPEYGVNPPTIASFSSRGGTPVDGTVRAKPDIAAPNGVNTSVDLGGFDIDGDPFPNFFGTSASAPHAAGVAALLIEARQKYYDDALTPDLVKGVLQNTAIDMEDPGFDVKSGAGFILADSALQSLANPSPFLTSISYDTTLVPGIDEILLTVYGEYLNDGATVWFNGAPLETESELQGDTAIVATIPTFEEPFPSIQVNNDAMEGTNGTDGGLSNTLYFTTKQTIFVSVDDTTKQYGEALPEFTASYSLETLDSSTPLDETGLDADVIQRIYDIPLTTIANNLSNVGFWGIEADEDDPLAPGSEVEATEALDIQILEDFNIVFSTGVMEITPMDLLVTPRDTTFVYGDSISGLTFDYALSPAGAALSNEDSLAIVSAVRQIHGVALVNRVALVRGTALVNDLGEQLLDEELLDNYSVMISQRLRLTRGTALVNGELIDPEELYNFAAIPNASARLVRGTALVNGFRLVRGTALVNTFDEDGNLEDTAPLTNSESLVNSSGLLNATTINADSNSETLVILGDTDVAILSGDSVGNVVMQSINLITGETVGTHITIPGTFLTNNLNVTYGLGSTTIAPASVEFEIDPESLLQVHDGSGKSVNVTATPDTVEYTVTYNGSEDLPINVGFYEVLVTSANSNFVGEASATFEIIQGEAEIVFDPESLEKVYNGEIQTPDYETVPPGLAIEFIYEIDVDPFPIDAGEYELNAEINDPNYFGSGSTPFTIIPASAEVIIDPSSLTHVYDGTGKTATATTTPEGLNLVFSFNGGSELPVNVGAYDVLVEIDEVNYVGSSTSVLNIYPANADILIDPASAVQVYDGTEKFPIFSTSPPGLPVSVSLAIPSIPAVDAGMYLFHLDIDDPNYIGIATTMVEIIPAQAEVIISAADFSQTYDGNPKSVEVTTVPEGLLVIVTYDEDVTNPVNAGTYEVSAEVIDENYEGSANATLEIAPATAYVSTGFYYIDKGGELPVFEASYEGFVDGDDESVIVSESFAFSPPYDGEAGTYALIPEPECPNYEFVRTNGTFHVNPAGAGTSVVKPYFDCYEAFEEPDENGFNHVAHFYYVNNNETAVYIPRGNWNKFLYADRDDTNLPEWFEPGSAEFTIPYDGSLLKWKLRSNRANGGKRTKYALTWDNQCDNAPKSNNNRGRGREVILPVEVSVYPNPTQDKVYVLLSAGKVDRLSVDVIDNYGRKVPIPSPILSDQIMELNLAGNSPGLYVVRIVGDSWVETQNVILK